MFVLVRCSDWCCVCSDMVKLRSLSQSPCECLTESLRTARVASLLKHLQQFPVGGSQPSLALPPPQGLNPGAQKDGIKRVMMVKLLEFHLCNSGLLVCVALMS